MEEQKRNRKIFLMNRWDYVRERRRIEEEKFNKE